MLSNSVAELGARDAEMSAVLDGMVQRLEDGFTAALQRARTAGELDPEQSPRALARLLVTAGQGLAVLAKVRPGGAYARDVIRTLKALL